MRVPVRVAFSAALASVVLLGACTTTTDGRVSSTPARPSASAPSSDTPTTPSAPVTVPKANLTDCSSDFNLAALTLPSAELGNLSVDCAAIAVPLNYSNPNGKKISIVMVRVHRKDVTPIGPLIVNPGGPGGSAVETALGLTPQLYKTLLTHFDLVGFDPRGVGLSTPITCLSDAQKDALNSASPDVLTKAGFEQASNDAKEFADACEQKYGPELPYFNTVNTARDMDLVRQALGSAQLNYLGFSYGTELGAQYLHLFPKTMRVAVLDGAVNPLTADITAAANQLQGFEGAFNQFAAYCVKNAACKRIGTPRTAVAKVVAVANKNNGIPTKAAGDNRRATSSLIYTGVLDALYSRSSWAALGTALYQAEHGNSAGLLRLADDYNQRYNGHYQNIADANLTISCNDSKPGPTDATIKATIASWAKRFPLFGLWSAASLFACQPWQTTLRTVPPLPTASSTPRKVLVIGNLHDPATPYQGAKDLARILGNAELLTWNGEGHTSYLQGSSCIDKKVNAYLISGTLPTPGTVCPR